MSKKHAYSAISHAFGRFFLLALLMAIPMLVLRFDIMFLKNNIGEQSATEALQQIFLAMTLGSFWYIARKDQNARYFGYLVCGFFACMLLRELDSYFDDLLPGSWKGPVLFVALYCIYKASKNINLCLESFMRFVQSPHFISLSLGLALLLVFSRLMGMSSFWRYLLGPDLGAVKSSIEESTELLAYSVMLYSSLSYVFEFKASQQKSLQRESLPTSGIKA